MWLKNKVYAIRGFSKKSLDSLAECKCIKEVLSYDEEYGVGRVTMNKYQAIWFTFYINFLVYDWIGTDLYKQIGIELSTL